MKLNFMGGMKPILAIEHLTFFVQNSFGGCKNVCYFISVDFSVKGCNLVGDKCFLPKDIHQWPAGCQGKNTFWLEIELPENEFEIFLSSDIYPLDTHHTPTLEQIDT